jgi:hypothetical protein
MPETVLSSRGVMWAISGYDNARCRALRLVMRAAVLGHLCQTALTQRMPACLLCVHTSAMLTVLQGGLQGHES